MASMNKVILLGNLTRDVEMRFAKSGTPVATLGLAVNTQSGSGDSKREEVLFVDVTAFGRTAELTSEYLSKGRSVLIEGRLKLDTWESQDGQKRSKHSVIAERIQFMPRGDQGNNGAAPRGTAPAKRASAHDGEDFAPPLEDSDDIPF